jgi:NADH dehydrogenase
MSLLSKQPTTKKEPVHVILIGNGTISLGVYRSLQKQLINRGNITLTIITQLPYHVCYGLMPECITGIVDHENLNSPIESCFTNARHIWGHATAIIPKLRQVRIKITNSQTVHISYDHLIIDNEYFNDALANNKTPVGFTIQSTLDMLKTKQQLDYLVERATAAKDKMAAARILRVCIGGSVKSGIELAGYIALYLKQACANYESLATIKPIVYLVTDDRMLAGYDSSHDRLYNYITGQLKEAGVKIIYERKIIRVNTDGVIFHDGSFINCSLVYNASIETDISVANNNPVILTEDSVSAVDKYGRLKGHTNIWIANSLYPESTRMLPAPADYIASVSNGKNIGKNIMLTLRSKPLKTLNPGSNIITGSLGPGKGFAAIGGLKFHGWAAWLFRCLLLLFYMPASNRRKCLGNYFHAVLWKHESLALFRFPKSNSLQKMNFQPAH